MSTVGSHWAELPSPGKGPMPEPQECRRATVSAPALGSSLEFGPGSLLTFGRDPTTDLCFPADSRLSRYAGEIRWGADGVLLTNTSARHSLFVESTSGSAELEPAGPDGSATAFVLSRGHATVAVPWPESGCRLIVEVLGGDVPEPPAGRNPSAPTTSDHGLRLQEDTKLFVTALLLCRPHLTGPATDPPVTPSIPELSREILVATDSFHLLRDFDDDGPGRDRLTGRVHDQLRELRAKVVRHGLAPTGSRLPPPALAELLVRHRVITRRHLLLLGDAAWRDAQSERWWR